MQSYINEWNEPITIICWRPCQWPLISFQMKQLPLPRLGLQLIFVTFGLCTPKHTHLFQIAWIWGRDHVCTRINWLRSPNKWWRTIRRCCLSITKMSSKMKKIQRGQCHLIRCNQYLLAIEGRQNERTHIRIDVAYNARQSLCVQVRVGKSQPA